MVGLEGGRSITGWQEVMFWFDGLFGVGYYEYLI